MPTILVASDAPTVRAEVAATAGRPDVVIREARSGPAVMVEVLRDRVQQSPGSSVGCFNVSTNGFASIEVMD